MKKTIVVMGVLASIVVVSSACDLTVGCPSPQVACGDYGGCAPAGSVCCDSAGDYCNEGYVCGPANTCLSAGVNNDVNSCESCLASAEQCCLNTDSTIDCSQIGRVCCGDHTSCPAGFLCSGNECVQ